MLVWHWRTKCDPIESAEEFGNRYPTREVEKFNARSLRRHPANTQIAMRSLSSVKPPLLPGLSVSCGSAAAWLADTLVVFVVSARPLPDPHAADRATVDLM